jgi:desulfoferrodoxin (superoxide reductase-like protein)
MPLPVPKPNIPEVEVKKENAKVKTTVGRSDDQLRPPHHYRWQAGPARVRPRS